MAQQGRSERVPKELQAKFDDITQLTDAFSKEFLNEEWAQLCRHLTAALSRKRPSPLLSGKAPTWASGIVHALGSVNFLFDASQKLHLKAPQIAEYFGISHSTSQTKSKQIRDLLNIGVYDPNWTLPSRMDRNPLAWMITINGLVVDARYAPREIQEEALRRGLIPYIPTLPAKSE
ncbi:MAG: DUF6398 domain-containing protein [Chloroflexota bacterium]|nr:hypothetical protein [Chloroflexota bacterium]